MSGRALDRGDEVEVVKLFRFASEQVEELAASVGGVQRPVFASPRSSQAFPIGRLTDEDRARIHVNKARPQVLPVAFQEEKAVADVLGLGKKVNERLAGTAAVVLVEGGAPPDAWTLAGRYSVNGAKVEAEVHLLKGGKRVASVKGVGEKGKLDGLAERLAAAVQEKVAALEAGKP
jgi:hypothetical protein